MTISRDDAIVECNAVGKLPKRRKPIGWQVADVCADHGFLQAGLRQVHKIGDLESLIVRAGELWGKLPAGSVGPPPSREEKEVASAVQLPSGLERWWLLQRLWELRRAQQRRRAQCLVRDVLSHPERRGWGHRFLPCPLGRVGGGGGGYFVKDAIEVRDREKKSAMLCRLLAICSWMMMMVN